jgi:rod shape-determining protein MreC
MPVLKEDFLIGRIVEVNYFSSRVLLLDDLNSKIPVTLEPTGAQAILEGKGDDSITLNYLPDGFVAEDENTIFTSGKDGFFLPGIPIGKTLLNDEGKLTAKLFADINQLTIVKVIKINSKNNSNF